MIAEVLRSRPEVRRSASEPYAFAELRGSEVDEFPLGSFVAALQTMALKASRGAAELRARFSYEPA